MTEKKSAPRPLGALGPLDAPLTKLLGSKTAQQLAKQGLETGRDLLHLLPRRYDTWGDLTPLAALREDERVTIQAQVVHATSRRTRSGRPPALMEATVTDGLSQMDVVLFGAAGLMQRYATQLAPGSTVLLAGKVSLRHGRPQLTNPRFHLLDDLDEAEREDLLARPVPIYPATEALPSWRVRTALRVLLDQLTPVDLPDPLPQVLRDEHGFIDAFTAWQWIHNPATTEQWQQARERLRFEEAFVLQAALVQRRLRHNAGPAAVAWPLPGPASLRDQLDASLPYELTGAQRRVGDELAEALNSTTPMQTLVQGDVGSGKTLVALRAMLQVVGSGGQAALLAPTEVLAGQHHASLSAVLGPLGQAGLLGGVADGTRIYLLTGSTSTAERKRILAALAGGEPAIVVGTHALLSDTVQLPFLGLVVVDEQHRFGVSQRDALRERSATNPATGESTTPHMLVMTATPIPRTIAMTVFGDLDTAVLDELPAGRTPIATHLVPWSRESWVAGIWERAAKEIAEGGRVYVVCPRISVGEDSALLPDDELDDERQQLAAVEEWVERLAHEPALGGTEVVELTGPMSRDDKDAAMEAFSSGCAPIMVSTTVIEVGVDVPQASLMVILDADRFGLSQLHQLRGRVGRGQRASLCIAVTGVEVGSVAFRRLKAFAETTDGFALAEADLSLRSEGNVLGAAQSGRRSDLDLLQVSRDGDIIAQARAEAERVLGEDPELHEHRALAQVIAERLDEESQAYLQRS